MFDPEEIEGVRQVVRACAERDRRVLDRLIQEVRELHSSMRAIKPRSTTAVSLVASDGGNNALQFDPFHVQLVRFVDSYGKQLCLDAVSPTTDTDEISHAQFYADGSAKSALGQMILDLGVNPPNLNQLSHMIPSGKKIRENPDEVSPSWVQVYRDLCEWAVLYERICHRSFATDTLIVRDGQLRSKLFRGEYFIRFREQIETAIEKIRRHDRRRVFLVGLSKHSKVIDRYQLAMSIERIFPPGEPRFVPIPRHMEAKAYKWPEYARGAESEEGESPKFVAGDMFFVRFGPRLGDPIWTLDILSSQSNNAQEIFGYLLADAIDGFPVPFYPRCLQKAHEYAAVVDFDLAILQDAIMDSARNMLAYEDKHVLDAAGLREDFAARRYE